MVKKKILGDETVPQHVKHSWPLLVDLAVGKIVKITDEDYRTENVTGKHRIGGAKGNDAGHNVLGRAINSCGIDYDFPQNLEAELNEDQREKLARFLLNKYYRTVEDSEENNLFIASIPRGIRDAWGLTQKYLEDIQERDSFKEITFLGVAQVSKGFIVVFTSRGSPEDARDYLKKLTNGKGKIEQRGKEGINRLLEKDVLRWIKEPALEKGGIEDPISALKEKYEEIREWRPNVY